MSFKRTISFALVPCARGLCQVRCRVSMPKQGRREFVLNARISPADWDASAQRPRPRKAADVSEEIRCVASALDEEFARWELIERRVPDISDIVRAGQSALGRQPCESPPLTPISEAFQLWQATTAGGDLIAAVGRLLMAVCPDGVTADLDDALLSRISQHCVSRGFQNGTTNAYLTRLKAFASWCASRGLRPNTPLTTHYLPSIKGCDPIYLTPAEMDAIRGLSLPPALDSTRSEFLLDCFCGLRHSDSNRLTTADVRGGALHVVTQKTRAALVIDLNAESARIVAERSALCLPGGRLFLREPVDTAVKKVRKVCRLADVTTPVSVVRLCGRERVSLTVPKWQVVGTHTARRTFVVTALSLGIPAEVVMKWTGHSSWNSLRPYVAIAERLRSDNMARFDNVLRPYPEPPQNGETGRAGKERQT